MRLLNGIQHAQFFSGDVIDICNDAFFAEHGRARCNYYRSATGRHARKAGGKNIGNRSAGSSLCKLQPGYTGKRLSFAG